MSGMDVGFIPITKVDVVQQEVWGVAAEEAPDKTGEIMDYAASKPHFETWSEGIRKASGGKSLGNVRAMHGAVAAGKVIHFEPRDDARQFAVGVKVVDEQEWAKVLEGVYTGFSVGGRYGKRWPDPETGLMRYEAIPAELSLADNPAMSGATFEVIKADGTRELRKFTGAEEAEEAEEADTSPVEPEATPEPEPEEEPEATLEPESESDSEETPAEEPEEGEPAPAEPEAPLTRATLAEELQKVTAPLVTENQRLAQALEQATTGVAALAKTAEVVAELTKRVAALEAQPVGPAPTIREVPGSEHLDRPSPPAGLSIEELRRLAALEPDPLRKAEYNRQALLAELTLGQHH